MNGMTARIAFDLASKFNSEWKKGDRRKYARLIRKIIRLSEKGYLGTRLQLFINRPLVIQGLKDEGFDVFERGEGLYFISWNTFSPPPELYPPEKPKEHQTFLPFNEGH